MTWLSSYFNKVNPIDAQPEWQDYYEGKYLNTTVFFGTRASPHLQCHYNNIIKKGAAAQSFGKVFYPERTTRIDQGQLGQGPRETGFTVEKNAAFWVGAIENNRPFLLISDINWYKTAALKGTVEEIFWLADHGYTFIPDPSNLTQTWLLPTVPASKIEIISYNDEQSSQSMEDKLTDIKNIIFNKRQEFSNPIFLEYASYTLMQTGLQLKDNDLLKSALFGLKQVSIQRPSVKIFYDIGKICQSMGTFSAMREMKEAFYQASQLINKELNASIDLLSSLQNELASIKGDRYNDAAKDCQKLIDSLSYVAPSTAINNLSLNSLTFAPSTPTFFSCSMSNKSPLKNEKKPEIVQRKIT